MPTLVKGLAPLGWLPPGVAAPDGRMRDDDKGVLYSCAGCLVWRARGLNFSLRNADVFEDYAAVEQQVAAMLMGRA